MRTPWTMDYGLRVAALLLVLTSGAAAQTTNRIVAIVNDDVITEGDIQSQVVALLQQHDLSDPTTEEAEEVRRAVLQRLIEERLIIQEAKRLGLTVGADEVGERLAAIREQLGAPERYQQMLQETQLSEEQLKSKLRDQLLAQKAIEQQVRSRIVVSPSELTARAGGGQPAPSDSGEEVRAYHLLIRVTDERSEHQARQLIQQLHERLLGGEDFEKLARQYSEGPHAQGGGLIEWVSPGELLPELDAVLFQLQPGGLSTPIQSRLGFHLVKVVERRRLSSAEAAESRQQMERQLYHQKFTDAMNRWLTELTDKAYIQLVDE